MFIRKRKNASGSVTVAVVMKQNGRFKEVKIFGTATSEEEISELFGEAQHWMLLNKWQASIDFDGERGRELEETRRVVDNVDAVLINGTQLLLGQIYDSIGFNRIPHDILRHLVIARVSQPRSKMATLEYLKSYYDEDVDLSRIYRYMDKLYQTQKDIVQQISVEHTRKTLGGSVGLMFYDVATLYFETSRTDVLRVPGLSKDGKTAESQVVLGLLVSEGGYPLSYFLYNGSQHKGYTMVPLIDDFRRRFNIGGDFVIVANAGLMNANNVRLLREAGCKYVIGARIKNEKEGIREWILGWDKKDGEFIEHRRDNGERLIVGYSDARAKKDSYNRDRGGGTSPQGIQERDADQVTGEQAWLQQVP